MTTTTESKTKTELVREILKEIGALSENPPKGWRKQVEDELAKQDLKMHPVTIYQTRTKELARLSGEDGANEPAQKTRKPRQVKVSPNDALTIGDIRDIRDFAQRFGGLNGLAEAISAIQMLIG